MFRVCNCRIYDAESCANSPQEQVIVSQTVTERMRRGGELHGKIKWRSEDSNGILENITILLRHIIFTNPQKDCNMLGVTLQRKKLILQERFMAKLGTGRKAVVSWN